MPCLSPRGYRTQPGVLTPATGSIKRPALTRRIKIVLVLEKWGWVGELLEYRALSELRPVLGLAVLRGRKISIWDV